MANLEELQSKVASARAELLLAVAAQCPGFHEPRQHRDGKPPWCRACGLTVDGRRAPGLTVEGRQS